MGYPAFWKFLFGNSDKLLGSLFPFGTTVPKVNSGSGSAGTSTEPARADHVHPAQTTISGNAETASKLATAHTITLKGDATGSTAFDGSEDVSISTTIATMKGATSSAAGAKGLVPAPAKGNQTKYLRGDGTWQTPPDTNTDTKVTQTVTTTAEDYPVLTTELADATENRTEGVRFDTKVKINHSTGNVTAPTFTGNLKGNVTGNVSGSSGSCTGNAATASKWSSAKTIALSGAVTGSGSVDGSKAVTITTTLANSGVTAGSYGLSANVTPADGATFNVPLIAVNAKGLVTSAKTCTVKLPTNVGTADKLTTARYIDGVSFNGSANITHYGTCSTAAGTAAKTVALSGFVLGTGARVQVKFTNANTNTSATLNVNNTGAKAIYDQNGKITADAIKANGLYEFVYDGTYWRMLNGGGTAYAEGISEAFRKSWIGVPRWWRSTTLPPNHCWANGDFVEFADWPELKEVYDAGGFNGMLMAYNANSSTQAANLGKWRPDAAKPTGLYTPNLSEQFLRASTGQLAGTWHEDTVRNATGIVGEVLNFRDGGVFYHGTTYYPRTLLNQSTGTSGIVYFDLSRTVPTGPQIAPQHVYTPIVIYLGK